MVPRNSPCVQQGRYQLRVNLEAVARALRIAANRQALRSDVIELILNVPSKTVL